MRKSSLTAIALALHYPYDGRMFNWAKHFPVFRRLIGSVKTYRTEFMFGIVGTVILSLIDAGFFWLIKPIINQGFIARDEHFIRWLPVLVVVIFLFRGVAGFASNYYITLVARNVVMDYRQKLFDQLLRLPATFYDQYSSGYLLSTIIYNVEQLAQASSEALLTVLRETSLLIGLVIVMFLVSWELSLIFLIVTPVISWIVRASSKRLRRLSSNVQESVGDVAHVAEEAIEGYKVIRIYGGQTYERNKFIDATRRNRHRELKVVVTNSIGTATIQFMIAIPIAITLFVATMPSIGISAGSFAAVVAAMINLLRPMRRLTLVNSDIQKGLAGAESVFRLLDAEVEKDKGHQQLQHATGAIAFENVSFAYPRSKTPVLQGIDFHIEPGQRIAFVGKSGAGKSTIINLLPRFYEASAGKITLDGRDIRDYRLADLRRQFSLVSQHTMLFDDTIAKNIAYGIQDVDREEIYRVAELAHALEFIDKLPDGIDTRVGENGTLLSGGQKQRIAIARALLKNAPILILDEATSSLDMESERLIQDGLETLMVNRTTLIIAHRLSTVVHADCILVIEDGTIIGHGNHKSLFNSCATYAKLYKIQSENSALSG